MHMYFPTNIRPAVKNALSLVSNLEEIRVRTGQNIILVDKDSKYYITNDGMLTSDKTKGIKITTNQIEDILKLMTKNSIYASKDEIINGFITLESGARVGICGKGVVESEKVKYIKEISSLNIRVPREVKNFGKDIYNNLFNCPKNLLVISPPGYGKTTLLRNLATLASNDGYNVSIVDERREIAPFIDGKSLFDIGENTDVISGIRKDIGVNMVLRSMTPQIIVVDEISTKSDIESIFKTVNSGVKVFASFHANSKIEFLKKYSEISYISNIFDNYIFIHKKLGSNRTLTYE